MPQETYESAADQPSFGGSGHQVSATRGLTDPYHPPKTKSQLERHRPDVIKEEEEPENDAEEDSAGHTDQPVGQQRRHVANEAKPLPESQTAAESDMRPTISITIDEHPKLENTLLSNSEEVTLK